MRLKSRWALWALAGLVGLTGSALAQVLPRSTDRSGRATDDTGKAFQFSIKRRSVKGAVKSLDSDRKTLVLDLGKEKEIPIDVGPSLIKAGKGSATFADIKVGDKISVYGESTVQGGVRAMEITLPKERMSIAPPSKPKREKKPKEAEAKEAKEAKEGEKAEGEKKAEEGEKAPDKGDK